MSDTTDPSPATDTPPPAKKHHCSRVNSKYLEEIALSGKLVAQARLPESIAPLADHDFPPDEVTALETSAADLNLSAQLAVGRTAARMLGTQEEQTARAALLASIQPIRAGAKRSHRGSGNEAGRDTYFVNEPTDVSLERLLFIAGAMLLKLTPQPGPDGSGPLPAEEALKGVTPQKLADLTLARDTYIDKDAATIATVNQAAAHRQQAEARFAQTRARRIDLQLAADQAWPSTDPAHAAIRHAFHIPPDRPAHE